MRHWLATQQSQQEQVGTFVTDLDAIQAMIEKEIPNYEFPTEGDRAGQGVIMLPEEAKKYVLPGVVPRSALTPDVGVVREYRGQRGLYADRNKVDLGVCDSTQAIVYTRYGFNRDPEVPEKDKASDEWSHVWIVTQGNRGPEGPSPIGPNGFLRNVAGANKRWDLFAGTSVCRIAEAFMQKRSEQADDTPLLESASWEFCEWVVQYAGLRDAEVRNLMSSVDPDSIRYSTVKKVIDTHASLVSTAQASMDYWKHWALVG